jgi:hypothetical protein
MYDEDTLSALALDICKSIVDPRYIRVNGRPLIMIYRPLLIPSVHDVVTILRDRILNATGMEVHLVFVESMEATKADFDPMALGFDATAEFPPQGIGAPVSDTREVYKVGWQGHRYDYNETIVNAVCRKTVAWPRYPAAFPSWDNTARQPLLGTSFDRTSPEAYQYYLEAKIIEAKERFCGDSQIVFINAWNEWAEGAHLEPDQRFGHRWLEATRQALLRTGSL